MKMFESPPGDIKLLSLSDFKKGKNLSIAHLLEAAASGLFPLFVPTPPDRKVLRIDKATNKLAIDTEFVTNQLYDGWRPALLRLSLSTCKSLAAQGSAQATDFPYGLWLDRLEPDPMAKKEDTLASSIGDMTPAPIVGPSDRVRVVAVPPNRECFPETLDTMPTCWRLFHLDEPDASASVAMLVTPDMVRTRSEYAWTLESLRKTGSRAAAGKSNDNYVERHDTPRRRLADLAEKYALANPGSCGTLDGLVECVMDLRDQDEFLALRPNGKPFSRHWILETLRERFDFSTGKPVRKPFTERA